MPSSTNYSTRMFDVCGEPGGFSLCCLTLFCSCLTSGEINERADGPAGWIGGCLFDFVLTYSAMITGFPFCGLCIMTGAHGMRFEHDSLKNWLKALCCSPCYACQLTREFRLLAREEKAKDVELAETSPKTLKKEEA